MSTDPRENHLDYLEFPAPSAAAFAATRRFYEQVFGWSFQNWGDDYSDTKDSGLGSGINADPAHRSSAPLPVIYVSDLEAARQRVIEAGGKLARDIFAFPGGRRFEYLDPAGNRLGVWSDK